MIFTETSLKGAYSIELEKRADERGFFMRTWCEKEFSERNLLHHFSQANASANKLKGTLRGLHYQIAPHEETKLVRCVRGALFYVILDVREGSQTHGQWLGFELDSRRSNALYVPGGCAVGYQTLEDDTEMNYQVSEFYTPNFERGIRYDDRKFGIRWPLPVATISDKDKAWPDYHDDHR